MSSGCKISVDLARMYMFSQKINNFNNRFGYDSLNSVFESCFPIHLITPNPKVDTHVYSKPLAKFWWNLVHLSWLIFPRGYISRLSAHANPTQYGWCHVCQHLVFTIFLRWFWKPLIRRAYLVVKSVCSPSYHGMIFFLVNFPEIVRA